MHHAGRVVRADRARGASLRFRQRPRSERDRGDRRAPAPQARQRRDRDAARIRIPRPGRRRHEGRLDPPAAVVGRRDLDPRCLDSCRRRAALPVRAPRRTAGGERPDGRSQPADRRDQASSAARCRCRRYSPIRASKRRCRATTGRSRTWRRRTLVRSRSLVGRDARAAGERRQRRRAAASTRSSGPGGALLVAVARTIVDRRRTVLSRRRGGRPPDRRAVGQPNTCESWRRRSSCSPLVLLAAIFVQITVGLAPLETLAGGGERRGRAARRRGWRWPRRARCSRSPTRSTACSKPRRRRWPVRARAPPTWPTASRRRCRCCRPTSGCCAGRARRNSPTTSNGAPGRSGVTSSASWRAPAWRRAFPATRQCRVAETRRPASSPSSNATPGGERLAFCVDVADDLDGADRGRRPLRNPRQPDRERRPVRAIVGPRRR